MNVRIFLNLKSSGTIVISSKKFSGSKLLSRLSRLRGRGLGNQALELRDSSGSPPLQDRSDACNFKPDDGQNYEHNKGHHLFLMRQQRDVRTRKVHGHFQTSNGAPEAEPFFRAWQRREEPLGLRLRACLDSLNTPPIVTPPQTHEFPLCKRPRKQPSSRVSRTVDRGTP